jgi:hypothetical protein
MLRWTALILAFGLMAPAVYLAGQALGRRSAATAPSTPTVETIAGPITAVDVSSRQPQVQLATSRGFVTVRLEPQITSVWRDGRQVPLNALEVGQVVEVRHMFLHQDGTEVAESIAVLPPPLS